VLVWLGWYPSLVLSTTQPAIRFLIQAPNRSLIHTTSRDSPSNLEPSNLEPSSTDPPNLERRTSNLEPPSAETP
jgi:hypothetical protein